MITITLLIALLPFSSEPGLRLSVSVDQQTLVLRGSFQGVCPKDVPIIYCGYGNFWPEVVEASGRRPRLTQFGQGARDQLFKYRGGQRDFAWPVLDRGTSPWTFGEFPIKAVYNLEPGTPYWVRGIYDNEADVRKVTLRSGFVRFTVPRP